MNYVVAEGVDFANELKAALSTNRENRELCMLSQTPLERHAITLPCGHKFNYSPLATEIDTFKSCKRVYHGFSPISVYQIMCPYCRKIHNGVLPFIPGCGVDRKTGVNAPSTRALPHRKCTHILSSGERKGQQCGNSGFESDHGDICERHFNLAERKAAKSGVHDTLCSEGRKLMKLSMKQLRELANNTPNYPLKKKGFNTRSKLGIVQALQASTQG